MRTVGRFGTGVTNDRRWRLREFAKSHRLTLANTLLPHKLSRTATWHAPNGPIHNQIDIDQMINFKYLGVTVCKDGTCSAEDRISTASAMAAMARLSKIWRCNTIDYASKLKLSKSLVTSIFLYGCETMTLLANLKKKKSRFLKPSA